MYKRQVIEGLTPSGLRKVIDILLQNGLLHVTVNGDLAISRDLYTMTLYDLYAIIPSGFWGDENGLLISGGNSVHLKTISKGVTECLKNSMDLPLAPLLEDINQQPE